MRSAGACSLDCEQDELPSRIAGSALAGLERRVISSSHVLRGAAEYLLYGHALRTGWHRDRESDRWFPIEEPLPMLAGMPKRADLAVTLTSILYGSIDLAIEAGGSRIEVGIGNVDDSLVLLVRFIQILQAGGFPHAALADRASTHFVVQDGGGGRIRRFILSARRDTGQQVIDVLVDADALLRQFMSLAAVIADHALFFHHYVCHVCLPTDEYDRVSEQAEADWQEGVASGEFVDDPDAEQLFVATRIAAHVPLPEECRRHAEREQAMLRSLEIPEEWLERHGLASA